MRKENEILPTIEFLDLKKDTENILGSSLTGRKRSLFGKEFYFYEDGSVLFLGEGRLSMVFELNNSSGSLEVKVTDKEGFACKELAEKLAREVQNNNLLIEFTERGNKRKIIPKMSLAVVMRIFRRLGQAQILTPEFYGFTVRKNPENQEIQEFQFMEKINAPTVASILQADVIEITEEDGNGASKFIIDPKFPYANFLAELSLNYFNNDLCSLIKAFQVSLRSFLIKVRSAMSGIADWETDNIFVIDYDGVSQEFRFMLIDPIEEEVLILPIERGEVVISKKFKRSKIT